MRGTEDMVRAEAAKAERDAMAIFAKMEAAAKPDRYGSRPLIPAGFEAEAERASDLTRRARTLTAEAGEMRAEAASAALQLSPTLALGAKALKTAPSAPIKPVETADTVASRILNSDSAVASVPPLATAAADTVGAIVARILEA